MSYQIKQSIAEFLFRETMQSESLRWAPSHQFSPPPPLEDGIPRYVYPSIVYDEKQIIAFVSRLQGFWKRMDKELVCPAVVASFFFREKYVTEEMKLPKKIKSEINLDKEVVSLKYALRDIMRLAKSPLLEGKIETKEDAEVVPLPIDACVLYLTLNPEDQFTALRELCFELTTLRCNMNLVGMNKNDFPPNIPKVLASRLMSPSKSNRLFKELDIDTKDQALIFKFLSQDRRFIENLEFAVETRGGYHLVYLNDRFPNDSAYKLSKLPEFQVEKKTRDGKMIQQPLFEIKSNPQIPVPGTLQGGFPVQMVSFGAEFVWECTCSDELNQKQGAEEKSE